MNLLLYTNQLCDGGAERVMSVLANELSELGHKVTLVTDYKSPRDYFLSDNVDLVVNDGLYENKNQNFIQRTFHRIYTVRQLCQKKEIDIVLSFLVNVNFRSLLATVGLKTKNIISVRVDPNIEYSKLKTRILASALYWRAKGIVFQTEEALRNFPWKTEEISAVIPNPLSDEFFGGVHNEVEPYTIVSAGRLTEQKNFPMLIKAFANLSSKYPQAKLKIYGQGHLKDKLTNLIDSLNINDKVDLPGNVSNLPEIYRDVTMFILCSDYEGMPNALMEAMAAGVPCIATDCDGGGARFLINDGINGFLIPKNNIDVLIEKMDLLLENKELRESISMNGASRSLEFRKENIVMKWEKFFYDVLTKN